MKTVRVEYVIKRDGHYIQENDTVGLFNQVNDIKYATSFGSVESVTSYIENDLRLNIANVSIHEIKTVVTETPQVMCKGKLVNINTVFNCEHCGKWFPLAEKNLYRLDYGSPQNEYCDACFDEIESSTPGI